MGDGSRIPRALIVLAMMLATGCIDFVAPTGLNIGGPAIFQASLRLDEDGAVRVDGSLDPGIDADGFRRTVTRETMIALGTSIPPAQVDAQGSRGYLATWVADPAAVAGPLTLEAPVVEDVGPPPAIRWGGIVRLDPATITIDSSDDLTLRTMTVGRDEPTPLNTSWNLLLRRGDDVLRIGANGRPPSVIEVPERWLPGDTGVIAGELTYLRSHSTESGASYVGSFSASVTLRWTIVRISSGARAERGAGG